MHRGRMDEWAGFYERLFNFREIKYFDIEGQVTGVKSKAMTSPAARSASPSMKRARKRPARSRSTWTCTTAKASSTSRWGSDNLYETVDQLRAGGVKLLDTIDTYYELVDKRLPDHARMWPS
ncbi:VOC family protein [Comamonas sp. JC664]|uniref:VOC family protein n=1 Tax=Comamonas sp. JC664 TaxID=2801917 RepID=UPI00361EC5D0